MSWTASNGGTIPFVHAQVYADFSARCLSCGRVAVIPKALALRLWPEGILYREMAASLTCSACGHRGAEMATVTPHGGWASDKPVVTLYSVQKWWAVRGGRSSPNRRTS